MAAIHSNGGNRWNILGFSFTKRDALSSVYKISMVQVLYVEKIICSYSTRLQAYQSHSRTVVTRKDPLRILRTRGMT